MRGTVIDLAAPRGVPIVVLFWSPGSAHCQALLPAILAAEQLSNPPGMIIVSQGPIGLTQDVGFRAPVVFDDDRSLARTFGVDGTPAAAVLDGQGRVATHVFRGETQVRALLDRNADLAATPPAASASTARRRRRDGMASAPSSRCSSCLSHRRLPGTSRPRHR
jgi:thiol-disulfide isomerase/thioredoxin